MKLAIIIFDDLTETGLRDVLVKFRDLLDTNDPRKTHERKRLIVALAITDDQFGRVRVLGGADKDGVPTGEAVGPCTATIDNPALASVAPDPTDATAFIVTPIAPPDGSPAQRTVNVTVTETATGISKVSTISIGPGAEASLLVEETALSAAPASAVAG